MPFFLRPRAWIAGLLVLATAASARAQAFKVGERAEYEVRYGVLHAGSGSLSVVSIDTVRGHDAYRFRMTFSAGVNLLLYKYTARDTMESWVDTATFSSLRFNQDQVDRGRRRTKRYEIYPDRRTFTDGNEPEQPSVENPLDDISFLYYVRTLNLAVGETREISRHFKPATNPLVLRILRRDTIEAAGRKWATIVVRPIIKTSTMFSEHSEAQVWMSDDPSHVIVQINVKAPVGSITMRLRDYQP